MMKERDRLEIEKANHNLERLWIQLNQINRKLSELLQLFEYYKQIEFSAKRDAEK